MKTIIFPQAKKSLKRITKINQFLIDRKITSLKNPTLTNIKPLKGYKGYYRARVGDYRIIFKKTKTEILIIAPLCPVEPCPTQTKSFYSELQLTLKGEDITQYPRLNSEGMFELEVPAGKYSLVLEPCNWLGCKGEFPKEITIEENKTTNLEINLDTGIR